MYYAFLGGNIDGFTLWGRMSLLLIGKKLQSIGEADMASHLGTYNILELSFDRKQVGQIFIYDIAMSSHGSLEYKSRNHVQCHRLLDLKPSVLCII